MDPFLVQAVVKGASTVAERVREQDDNINLGCGSNLNSYVLLNLMHVRSLTGIAAGTACGFLHMQYPRSLHVSTAVLASMVLVDCWQKARSPIEIHF